MFKTAGDSTRSVHSVLIKVNKREKTPRIMTNQSEDDRDVSSGGVEKRFRHQADTTVWRDLSNCRLPQVKWNWIKPS